MTNPAIDALRAAAAAAIEQSDAAVAVILDLRGRAVDVTEIADIAAQLQAGADRLRAAIANAAAASGPNDPPPAQ